MHEPHNIKKRLKDNLVLGMIIAVIAFSGCGEKSHEKHIARRSLNLDEIKDGARFYDSTMTVSSQRPNSVVVFRYIIPRYCDGNYLSAVEWEDITSKKKKIEKLEVVIEDNFVTCIYLPDGVSVSSNMVTTEFNSDSIAVVESYNGSIYHVKTPIIINE